MDRSRQPLSHVLVKPAGADCNLRCAYCFYRGKAALYPAARRRMSEAVLGELVRQMLDAGAPVVSFCWQGGEPTLMGLGFFRKVVAAQQRWARPGQLVTNSLQTNGLLLDDDWCRFLGEHRILVGLSIDGPADLHDSYRRRPDGKATWGRVRRAVSRLRAHDVEHNAMVLLTDRSAGRVAEIWRSLAALGLRHLQLIPCLEWDEGGAGPTGARRWAPYSISPEALGEALCAAFDLWRGDFAHGLPGTFVRWFEALLFSYVGKVPPLCTIREECGDNLVVEHNGDVYPCDFYVTPEHRLGNLTTEPLTQLVAGERQRQFGERKRALGAECRECHWREHCWGGCPRDREHSLVDGGPNPYCHAYRVFFAHADAEFRRMAAEWRALVGEPA